MSRNVATIRQALADHAPPRDDRPGCTFCQGALAALDALERERDELREQAGERMATSDYGALVVARDALAAIADGFNDPTSVGYRAHEAGLRQIARAALARVQPAEEPT